MSAFVFASDGETIAYRALRRQYGRANGVLRALATDTGCLVTPQVRKGLATATWSFNAKRNTHLVTLGDSFATALNVPPIRSVSPASMDRHAGRLADALLRHEAWHGRITERDIEAIAADAKRRGVPFVVLNLFEDIRIEQAARAAEKVPFKWRKYFRVVTTNNPTVMLSNCTTVEYETGHGWTGDHTNLKVVRTFFTRAQALTSTQAALDLAEEWVHHWDAAGRTDHRTMPAGVPRASAQVGAENDGSALISVAAPIAVDGHGAYRGGSDTTPTAATSRVRWSTFVDAAKAAERGPVDAAHVRRLAERLGRVLAATASPRTARVSTSGNRLHMAGVMTGSAQSFRSHGKTGGKPKLCVVIDFSGSMSEDWVEHGRVFMAAVSHLARQGVIDATIIATGGGAHAVLPTTLTPQEVNALHPNKRTESIAATLEASRAEVMDADFTVVYTDARITDGAVDAGAWRRRGVELIGAVVCPHDERALAYTQADMTTHFGRSIIGTTGEDLAIKLAQYLGSRVGR